MKNGKQNLKTVKKVLSFLSEYRVLMAISLVFTLISTLLSLYIPLVFGRAIDLIAGKAAVDFPEIKKQLLTAASLVGASAFLLWCFSAINNRITFGVVRDIRNRAFEKLNILPLSYLDSHRGGETLSKTVGDVTQFSEGLLLGFSKFFSGAVSIAGTLVLLFRLNFAVALVVVVLTPLSLFGAKFISSRSYRYFTRRTKTRAALTALTEEAVSEIKTLKAFSREEKTEGEFEAINGELDAISLKAVFFSSLTNPFTRFVNALVYACAALVGAICVISGQGLTVGLLATVLSYANQYTKPFNEISSVFAELQNALACAEGVIELIETPGEAEPENPLELTEVKGGVCACGVDFSYSKKQELIKDMSFSAAPGTVTAIVGTTGCGKTTLINLLMRFYDVDRGKILLDGVDINDITRKELRKHCSMVLQDTWIKGGTVKDNIALGKPDATEEEIIEAAKKAHAHSFIKRLPQGYNTLLSENGDGLSQGEKQLICITRVMLRSSPILILDEATSSIDLRTEIKVQKAFNELMSHSTVFVVAHRLSTIMNADNIICMDNGRILEQGTHEELLKRNGAYARLWYSTLK